jgi:hypothetical protein
VVSRIFEEAELKLARKAKGTVTSVARTMLGAVAFAVKGNTPPQAYQAMLQLFCLTGGYSNDAMSAWISARHRAYKLPDATGILGSLSAERLAGITNDLAEKGYHVFPQKLPDDLCDDLLKLATTMPCIGRATDAREDADERLDRFPRENPRVIRYDFSERDLVQHPEIQRVMADRSMIAVAQSYLRSSPILDIVTMWWNTAASKHPDKKAAQFWHFDMDRIKWLKFFIYLTDVGPENGPHSFVSGSHRRGAIPQNLLEQGYSRLTDEEVEQQYKKDDFIEFSAPRGTIIAEDTRGLHKGKNVVREDRLVLQFQFCNSLFGGNLEPAVIEKVLDKDLERMIKEYPRVYSHLPTRLGADR